MPFNDDYKETMARIAETGESVAKEYAETQNSGAQNKENSAIDWGGLVNGFANAASQWAANRNNNNGRQWNDFEVEARVDKSTQNTIILIVCILAGALIFFGIRTGKGKK